MSIQIRAIEPEDREQVVELLVNRWTSPEQLLDGEVVDASKLPGYLALNEGRLVGMITLIKRESEWEILTLDSLQRWGGSERFCWMRLWMLRGMRMLVALWCAHPTTTLMPSGSIKDVVSTWKRWCGASLMRNAS